MSEPTPQVPWSESATEAEARSAFDRVQAKYRDVWAAIGRQEPFTIAMGGLSEPQRDSLREAVEVQCLMVWGQRPLVAGDSETVRVIPREPPDPPDFCASCGASLHAGLSSLRWQSPGRAALQGSTGWEHQCDPREPQAGHFAADVIVPEGETEAAALARIADTNAAWRWHAERRADERRADADDQRAKDKGHQFGAYVNASEPPECTQCGLSKWAFFKTPDEARFSCPGAPACVPANPPAREPSLLERVDAELAHVDAEIEATPEAERLCCKPWGKLVMRKMWLRSFRDQAYQYMQSRGVPS